MDMRIPPLKLKILLESNPLKFRIVVRRLAVAQHRCRRKRQSDIVRRDSCEITTARHRHISYGDLTRISPTIFSETMISCEMYVARGVTFMYSFELIVFVCLLFLKL